MKTILKIPTAGMACVLISLLGGCAVGPDYEIPETATELGVELKQGNLDMASIRWWDQFESPELTDLIAYTLEHSPQLDAARHRWAKSVLMAEQAGAQRQPRLDGNLSVSRQERSENGMFPVVDGMPGFPDRTETLAHGGLQLSWEIDVFGWLSQQTVAAEKGALMAEIKVEDAWRLLCSELGRRFVLYASAQEQLSFIEDQIEYAKSIAEMDEKRVKLGVLASSKVDADRVVVASLEALVPDLEHASELALIQMSVLTTIEKEELRSRLAKVALPEVDWSGRFDNVSVDTEFLLSRPDVRIAKASFEQGLIRRNIAVKNLYPRLVLLGWFGLESIRSDELFDSASRFWNLGPALTLPLFNGGQLRKQVNVETEELEARYAEFRSSFLNAVGEVHASLSQFESSLHSSEAQERLVASLENQYHTIEVQKETGLVSDSELLAAKMSVLSAKAERIRKRSAVPLALINLCQSVGGTWDQDGEVD